MKNGLRDALPVSVPDFPIDVVSGMGVGVIGAALGSPFQLVKTRIQSFSKSGAAFGDQYQYKNLADGLRNIWREEGLRGLRRAVDACMLRVAIASAVQLSTYDLAKRQLLRLNERKRSSSQQPLSPLAVHFLSSLSASFCIVSVINPLEVVNTRLYNQRGDLYKGTVDCFLKTARTEGVQGLYKGWRAHFMRVAPHTVLTFVFLEAIRARVLAAKSQ